MTVFIMAYTGAWPEPYHGAGKGRQPPDLKTVPVVPASCDPNFPFIFTLAFARDLGRDGIFRPASWDSQKGGVNDITPGYIEQLKRENSNRRFFASLGGG